MYTYLSPIRVRECAEKTEAGGGRSRCCSASALTQHSALSNKFQVSAVCIDHQSSISIVSDEPTQQYEMNFINILALLTSLSASAAFAPSRNTNLPYSQTSSSLDMGITLYGSQGSR